MPLKQTVDPVIQELLMQMLRRPHNCGPDCLCWEMMKEIDAKVTARLDANE